MSAHCGALRRIGLVALLAVVALVGAAGPLAAHGANGTMGIEVVPGTAPLTAQVRVLLEYSNDREVAPGATVTATATGPGGATVGPIPLSDRGAGSYDALLTLGAPGAWSVVVTAADPAATAEAAVTVTATPTTIDSSSTSVTRSDDARDPSDDAASADDGDGDGDGDAPSVLLLAVVAVVLVVVAGVAFTLVRRR